VRTLALAQSLADDLVALRRRLHRVPELGNELPITQSLVLEALAGLDLEVSVGKELSSVVAVLRGRGQPADHRERQVVLLRGDMDGLPVTEDLDIDYVSSHDGLMHACGHDLHVAGLVGAARILHELRDDLAGDVVLMFQPGEEGPGGAEPMIREGLLEAAGRRVDAAYALHVYSAEFPRGVWFGRPGPLMAAVDEVRVRVVGRGGHGSAPFRTKDPIPAACEMVLALQSMVTRTFDVFDPVVVTVGKIAGGTKENIIPDDAVLEATLRTLSEDNRVAVRDRVDRLVRGIAGAHGLEVEVDFTIGYPVTVNDPDEYAFAHETIVDLFGPDRYATMLEPEMGSEDFSFVAQEVPSAYVNLSVCPSDDWETAPDNHSPRAAFDDALLPDAAALLAELALRRLRR
jgi:hippurate hydrolase